MKPLSVYIHIPFCASKCAYCDFASYPNREADWTRYTEAVIRELDTWREILLSRRIETVFFGGGTPSLLPAEQIGRILSRIPLAEDAEVTLEGNPGTLTREKLRMYRTSGINRLSLGAQSFDDGELQMLGRIHTSDQINEAVSLAREAGFERINLDLIYALPGQTMERWQETLRRAVALDVPHLSAYSLIVEEGTPMHRRVASGEAVLPDEDTAVQMQRFATGFLAEHGYTRYEISNYAKAGYACRHNLVYWERGDYLGVGCAAHSMIDNERFENPRGLDAYLNGERRIERLTLDGEDALEETIMLGTRMTEGVSLSRLGEDFRERHRQTISRMEQHGLIRCDGGRLRLTERGMEVQNAVVLSLLTDR